MAMLRQAEDSLPPTNAGIVRPTGLFQQRLARRENGEFVQLGGDAGTIGIGFGGGQTLAQLDNFFFAGTAPANLGPSAGCGHEALLKLNLNSGSRSLAELGGWATTDNYLKSVAAKCQ